MLLGATPQITLQNWLSRDILAAALGVVAGALSHSVDATPGHSISLLLGLVSPQLLRPHLYTPRGS